MIRGGTKHIVDEVERVIEDCLGTLPAVIRTGKVLTGGGSTEVELSSRLRSLAENVEGIDRLGVEAFAKALEVIPKALAENAGFNPLEILVEMQSLNSKRGPGVLEHLRKVKDLFQENVIEPSQVKNGYYVASEWPYDFANY